MARILVLTWHGTPFGEQVYDALWRVKGEGNSLYLLSDCIVVPPPNLYESHFVADLHATSAVMQYIRGQPILFDAVVMKSSEWLTPLAALIADHFHAVGNTPHTALCCRSKYHMRRLLESSGIPTVRFKLCHNFDELLRATSALGGKLVAKPIGGNSSYGTFLITPGMSPTSLRECYERSINFLREKALSGDVVSYSLAEFRTFGIHSPVDMITDYLVEEYIEGTEVSVNSIVQHGHATILLLGEQIRMDAPYFMQVADRMPYECSGEVAEQIQDLNQQVINIFGITDSPVHMEIRLSSNGPRVLELACRIGGDNMHDAVYQVTGYNLFYEATKVALGEPRHYTVNNRCHIAARYLLPSSCGTIKAVRVPDSLRSDPNVTEIEVTVKCGDFVAPPPFRFDYLGYVQARGATPDEAQKNLERAIAQIDVQYLVSESA